MANKEEAISLFDSTDFAFSTSAIETDKGLRTEKRNDAGWTVVSDVVNKRAGLRSGNHDERVGTAPIFFDVIDAHETTARAYTIEFSDPYLKVKIAQFISSSKQLLQEWSDNLGTPNELKPLKNLLKLVEENGRYFDTKAHTRMVLASIQNFLLKWGSLEKDQINQIINLLSWFDEGEVEPDKAKSFGQEVFLATHRNTDHGEEE